MLRISCAGFSGGFRSTPNAETGNKVSDYVRNYYLFNNLQYDIGVEFVPGCRLSQGAISFETRIASDTVGTTWVASVSRVGGIATATLTAGQAKQQGRFHVGDPVLAYNCVDALSNPAPTFNVPTAFPAITLGPLAITGTIPTGLTVVYPNAGPDGSATCTIGNMQGTPDNFYAHHLSDFAVHPSNQAMDPGSPLLSPSTHPCVLAPHFTWINSISMPGGAAAASIGEGYRTTECAWNPATEEYHDVVIPARDTVVTCPGHTAGPGGIAACYYQYPGGGAPHITPTTIYGVTKPNCTTNDPVTEDCVGIVGEMGTPTFNYILSNWHDYRLCHGETPACNGKTSQYAAGQSRQASDGFDMGVKSFPAIDAAQVSSQYCTPSCSIGSFPDH